MARIYVKTHGLELDLEGEEEFVESRLSSLLSDNRLFVQASPAHSTKAGPSPRVSEDITQMREGTINSAISKLGGGSCRAVLLAAAVHLSLYQGKRRFTDDEWEATARQAHDWKVKWSVEKATAKKRLIKAGSIIENASGVYSLSLQAQAELEPKLV